MFIENKYKKIYFDLIEKRKNDPYCGEYVEKHHILPRSLGGSNDADNLVSLNLREHFLAHRLLEKMTIGESHIKMMWAIHRMLYAKKYTVNSKTYETLRTSHILFLRENHHSKRIDGWNEKMRDIAYSSWQNDVARREKFSSSMKKRVSEWKENDPEGYLEEQRKRSKIGAQKSAEITRKKIEYNGIVYDGWSSLSEQTGVTKHLYNKFYVHGIDPIFRVGKDGPMTLEDIEVALEKFCESLDEIYPLDPQQKLTYLTRMMNVGIISSAQLKQFCNYHNL